MIRRARWAGRGWRPGVAAIGGRLPRRTVRLRLTALYVGLFLASAAGVLVITYFLVSQTLPTVHTASCTNGGTAGLGTGSEFMIANGPGPAGVPGDLITSSGACPQQGLAMPTAVPGPNDGYVYSLQQQAAGATRVAISLRGDTLDKLLLESGIALGIMAVASIGLGWLMAGRVLRPLRTITAAARRVSSRNLHERIALDGPDDELKELGDTFDQLLGRLEASFRAQRQFVANASHELRTPLARQRTLLEVALRDKHASNEALRSACERAVAAGEQHERLIGAMLTLAQSERGLDRFEPVDLAEVAEDSLLTSTNAGAGDGDFAARRLTVSTALSPAPTLGDEKLAERLITNLIDNAIRYNVTGGWLEVATGMRRGRPFLAVSNTGAPIPPDQLGRLFQPFQRLDPVRDATGKGGLGLGLAIVTAIAAAHDAELAARAKPGGGLTVEITFPARPAVAAGYATVVTATAGPPGGVGGNASAVGGTAVQAGAAAAGYARPWVGPRPPD
jgi:signal transduction histidine kinase